MMEYYKLTNETVDLFSEKLAEMYESHGCSKKEILRARLLLEEALLKYRSRFGEDIELTFRQYRILNQTRFSVRIRSASFDPFTLEENPMAFMIETMLAGFEGSIPTWKYHNLENELVFTLRRKTTHSSLFIICVTAAVSLLLGIVARMTLSGQLLQTLVSGYLEPLANAYAGLFCIMAVLLTLFSVTLSIVHIGDAAAVGALGGRILRHFYLVVIAASVALLLPLMPFVPFGKDGVLSLAVQSIYDILIGFIPGNLVSPFLNFNSVHIMIIGAMFGFSLLSMGQKGDTVVKVFDECNMVAVLTNGFLNRFIFLYMAIKVFSAVTLSEFSAVQSALKMVIYILACEVVLFFVFALRGSTATHKSLGEYIKIGIPAFLISLSSGNLGAAFGSLFDGCIAFGGEENAMNLGANLGSVIFQPASALAMMVSTLFMAIQYNVEISVTWLLILVILSIVLVAAMPNIPGAAISIYTLLFAQLGIPSEALALVIAINALLQFPNVAVDTWCLETEIVLLSKKQEA